MCCARSRVTTVHPRTRLPNVTEESRSVGRKPESGTRTVSLFHKSPAHVRLWKGIGNSMGLEEDLTPRVTEEQLLLEVDVARQEFFDSLAGFNAVIADIPSHLPA